MATAVGEPCNRGVASVFAALLSVDLDDPASFRVHVAVLRAETLILNVRPRTARALHGRIRRR